MLNTMGKKAREAARQLSLLSHNEKDNALLQVADSLLEKQGDILMANNQDIGLAIKHGLSDALIDRLRITESRLQGIVNDLRGVASLPDPVGEVFEEADLPAGMKIRKQRIPVGVLAVIYESRPNVTVDIFGLAFKTGNSVILRGGSETIHSNKVLVDIIRQTLEKNSLPLNGVQFINDPSRERVAELLKMYDTIDMLIPRGGAALHKYCRENSMIPVITGGIGICHLFVDEFADFEKSIEVIRNAKIQRPSVCNALDTVLVHQNIAAKFIPLLVHALLNDRVEFRCDERALNLLGKKEKNVRLATIDDFDVEWLSLVLGVKVVDDIYEAIEHIQIHGTEHSDGILTDNPKNAETFVREINSAAVYVNASTRFTDGSQFGLGAEVAVSTQRLHARGPMALKELTTYKWIVTGNYNVRP